MTINDPTPISPAAALSREAARAGDGKFGTQHKPEVTDVDLSGDFTDPPVVALAGDKVRMGDQILVHERWMEVGESRYVEPVVFANPANSRPGHYVLSCSNGYQKAVRDGETIETVQADENGIPALTSTIRDQVLTRGYDSGDAEYADWCDTCADYQGFSVNNETFDPRNEVCHGCEDRAIAGYQPPTWGGDSGSFVNEHGVDMSPGQAPTPGHL